MNWPFWFLFVVGAAWLTYIYIGYPISLWALGLFRRFRPQARQAELPSVSVLISARNEEKDIAWKIQETLNWDYPADHLEVLIASDASEDRTDEIVLSCGDPRVKLIRLERRVGKNEALNRLARVAKGDLFFFTDANSHIGATCLRSMVSHFADPQVGCVTGADRTMKEEKESAIGVGEKSYWGYELQLQRLESMLGSVLICFGAIFCIRRSLFEPLQADLANDLELPIRIGSAGYVLLFEPEAWATERATRSATEEFNRRRRICAQGLLGCWRLRHVLKGFRAWQFFSRKFLRWTAVIPLLFAFVGSMGLLSRPIFAAMFLTQIALYLAASWGWLLSIRKCGHSGLFAVPFYFVLVNVAAIAGLFEACRGRRYSVWEVASLTRGAGANDIIGT